MIAIKKNPGEKSQVVDIPNTLEALQDAVGGNIETVTIASDACIVCNEEGRLMGLPYNCRILGLDFAGTVLIVGTCGDEFCNLSQRDIAFWERLL